MSFNKKNISDLAKKIHREKATISHKGYGLDRETVSDELFTKIKEELSVTPNIIPDFDFGTQSFPVFRFNNSKIYLPKFFGIKKFGKASNINERIGKDISLKFKGSLRPDQEFFTKKIIDHLSEHGSCLAQSETGSGKTVMGLWILSKISKKTLIIVHKEFLMNQWKDRIKQFLPKARIGTIRQDVIDVANKDIVIGMLQSISTKDYPKGTFESLGIVLFDECHHLCTKTFSKALFKVSSAKMLGLTATPKRKDGLTKVLKWFLGDIIEKEHLATRVEIPTVELIEASYENEIIPKYNFKKKVILPNLINQFVEDPGRNKIILDKIIQLSMDNNRKILMLTDRRNHCIHMKELLEDFFNKNTKNSKSIGLYMGSMKEADLNESNKCDIILATYSMAAEGYDNSTLDTLVMATGKSDIQQSVGRILRKKNENPPYIVDIIDPEFCFSQMNKRKQFYKKSRFKIVGYEPKAKVVEKVEFRD